MPRVIDYSQPLKHGSEKNKNIRGEGREKLQRVGVFHSCFGTGCMWWRGWGNSLDVCLSTRKADAVVGPSNPAS